MRYFTELEAAVIAGVSVDTVREFTAVGLLPSEERDGQPIFAQSALEAVFANIKASSESAINSHARSKENEPAQSAVPMKKQPEPEWDTPPSVIKIAQDPPVPANETVTDVNEAQSMPPPELEFEAINTPQVETLIEHKSFELLEMNRTLREQIQILREERDWLRRRIENLEVRSERDQMLLLSENRTVQELLPGRKKSFWSFALPWLKEKES